MRAKFLFEKFEEKSDPIRDLDIGIKPKEIFDSFFDSFQTKFGLTGFIDECGHDYETKHDEIHSFILDNFNNIGNPIYEKLFEVEHYELLYASTDRAAKHILKGGKRGFYYWNEGKVIYLGEGIIQFEDVIKKICEIRKVNIDVIKRKIKKMQKDVKSLNSLIKIIK